VSKTIPRVRFAALAMQTSAMSAPTSASLPAPRFRRGFFHRGEQFCTDAALKFGLGGECVHWLLAVRPMPLIALKESDPHSKRIVFDTVEWHFRLEQLAEMRRRTPTSARHDNAEGIVAASRET